MTSGCSNNSSRNSNSNSSSSNGSSSSGCDDCDRLTEEFDKNPGGKPLKTRGLVIAAVAGIKKNKKKTRIS